MVRKGKTPLRHGGCGSVHERMFSAENGDIGRDQGSGVHRGSEVFTTRRGNEDIVGVNGNIFVERGEEEGVKDFLSDLG